MHGARASVVCVEGGCRKHLFSFGRRQELWCHHLTEVPLAAPRKCSRAQEGTRRRPWIWPILQGSLALRSLAASVAVAFTLPNNGRCLDRESLHEVFTGLVDLPKRVLRIHQLRRPLFGKHIPWGPAI